MSENTPDEPPKKRRRLTPEEEKELERISIIEDRISEAIERGDFDNLPGLGKPIQWEDDRLVPTEYRLANRIMRDNDVMPEWVDLQKEIEKRTEAARKNIRRESLHYITTLADLVDKQDVDSVVKRLACLDRRDDVIARFRDEVRSINQKITRYNLLVPMSHLTKDLIDPNRELHTLFPSIK